MDKKLGDSAVAEVLYSMTIQIKMKRSASKFVRLCIHVCISHKRGIGKQWRPTSDAAASDQG